MIGQGRSSGLRIVLVEQRASLDESDRCVGQTAAIATQHWLAVDIEAAGGFSTRNVRRN
jgi:hypothetical protein